MTSIYEAGGCHSSCYIMRVEEYSIEDVGISAIEVYYPKNVVSQCDLEKFDGCSAGKYTIGLGQNEMGFCADNEDVVSISLTVTDALLRNYKINPKSIGFLAVGTETIIDKSKSVKTELMRLFDGNDDIEGVDVKNACFGGTQAVFHAIDWVYSNYATERRNAIAVLADIAVYEPGPARSTGGVAYSCYPVLWLTRESFFFFLNPVFSILGAGAIAVLITPDAPIAFDRGLRATYMTSTWDFYKPIDVSLSSFSAAMFHSPFTRMVQKALARLVYRALSPDSFEDRDVMRCLIHNSKSVWEEKTYPYLELNRRIGNMYTSSLFAQLVAFLAFGYVDDYYQFQIARLDNRQICSPELYTTALKMRENFLASEDKLPFGGPQERVHLVSITAPVTPIANLSDLPTLTLFPGTYYLTLVDEKYRRYYSRVPMDSSSQNNINGALNGIHGDVRNC
ncbi:hydroxymethylglutaryl-CoA synthase [Dictyocaulus viviparus]|uniref:Hydroxymethylglutaryl-CoA synthase n=1 Tax=Dictyocaulus viviparus TaxID=29172 RepID=A0A0D8XPB7_DICVI|nr:hydroxymethylglutaryl-CoA synthase [Dictyocaulus viviparus]